MNCWKFFHAVFILCHVTAMSSGNLILPLLISEKELIMDFLSQNIQQTFFTDNNPIKAWTIQKFTNIFATITMRYNRDFLTNFGIAGSGKGQLYRLWGKFGVRKIFCLPQKWQMNMAICHMFLTWINECLKCLGIPSFLTIFTSWASSFQAVLMAFNCRF